LGNICRRGRVHCCFTGHLVKIIKLFNAIYIYTYLCRVVGWWGGGGIDRQGIDRQETAGKEVAGKVAAGKQEKYWQVK
jgi:hypothetical protein